MDVDVDVDIDVDVDMHVCACAYLLPPQEKLECVHAKNTIDEASSALHA